VEQNEKLKYRDRIEKMETGGIPRRKREWRIVNKLTRNGMGCKMKGKYHKISRISNITPAANSQINLGKGHSIGTVHRGKMTG
jgi:hypothetical protein